MLPGRMSIWEQGLQLRMATGSCRTKWPELSPLSKTKRTLC